MSIANLKELMRIFTPDRQINASEAIHMTRYTEAADKPALVDMLGGKDLPGGIAPDGSRFEVTPDAQAIFRDFLGFNDVSGVGVVKLLPGADPSRFDGDVVYFGADGKIEGSSGVEPKPYTRSYAAQHAGPLRFAHGTKAPKSRILSSDEMARLHATTPGAALDRAARALGRETAFEKLANDLYDPKAPGWMGHCHAWSWSALSPWINARVDVDGGPEGTLAGLWIDGEWMSRADLGNWMMAVADTISRADGKVLDVTCSDASELIKGVQRFVMNDGGGVICDIHNDEREGSWQMWNQPFAHGATMETKTLLGDAAEKLVSLAAADGAQLPAKAKLVTIDARYGVERSDDYERQPATSGIQWNVYVVTNALGKMLKAYMAYDKRLDDIADLPTRDSANLVDYFWKPRLDAIRDVVAGRPNTAVERALLGREFEFYVGTVLAKGVPGPTRAAFEDEVLDAREGLDAEALAAKYPGVGNAYTEAQWREAFPKLDRAMFA